MGAFGGYRKKNEMIPMIKKNKIKTAIRKSHQFQVKIDSSQSDVSS